MNDKKYNHAFAVAFSVNSNMSKEQWIEYMQTKKGLATLGAHCIRRVMNIVEGDNYEAYDLWDSHEN